MMKQTIKSSLIAVILLSTSPAIAMEGGKPENAGTKEDKYDVEKAILAKRMAKEHDLPEDIANEINKMGVELSHFTFTCPTAEEVSEAKNNTKRLAYNVTPPNNSGIEFFVNDSEKGPFKFHGVVISNNTICLYKNNNATIHLTAIINGPFLDTTKCHAADEKFHADKIFKSKTGYSGYDVYTSENPQDIKIICEK